MSKERRIRQVPSRREFGQKCALRARAIAYIIDQESASRLVRSGGNRKFRRVSKSSDVGAPRAVDSNGIWPGCGSVAKHTPTNISRVEQLRSRRIQLGYESRKPIFGICALDSAL